MPAILAEIGVDKSQLPDEAHLCSRTGVGQGNITQTRGRKLLLASSHHMLIDKEDIQ